MRTMKWPPTPLNGRLGWVEGAEASAVVVLLTLSDLQTNPFNPRDLSLGDITFRVKVSNKARIDAALRRLARIISVEAIIEEPGADGTALKYTVRFRDLETRVPGEVVFG
jgi:hypothetical protein